MAKKSEHHVYHHLPKSLNILVITIAVVIAIVGIQYTGIEITPIQGAVVAENTLPTLCIDQDGDNIYVNDSVVVSTSEIGSEGRIEGTETKERISDYCEGNTVIEMTCGRRIPIKYTANGINVYKQESTINKHNCLAGCFEGACIKGVKVILTNIATNKPIYNAIIQFKRNREIKDQQKSNLEGEAVFRKRIINQVQEIIVQDDGYFLYSQEYRLEGKDEDEVHIALTPIVNIHVKDQAGLPVKETLLTLTHQNPDFIAKTTTDEEGKASIALNYSGPYKVQDTAPSAQTQNPGGLHVNRLSNERPLIITMTKNPFITFNVSNSEGRNLRNALVEFYDSNDNLVVGSTNYEGQVSVHLAPDTYKINVKSDIYHTQSLTHKAEKDTTIVVVLEKRI